MPLEIKNGRGESKYVGSVGKGSVSDPWRAINTDYHTEVVSGNVHKRRMMSAMGERESMGVTVSGEDIWRGNELTPALTQDTTIPIPDSAGEQMSVVSEHVDDTSAGTGARTVEVHYLDANGDEKTVIVTMNGTTPVDLTPSDVRFINDFHVESAGDGLVTAGHIKIYKTSNSDLVYNMIAKGGNQSLVPNKMIPAGHTLIIKGWHLSEAQGKRCAFRIRSTDKHGVLYPNIFLFKDTCYLNKTTSGPLVCNVEIPALSIVKASAWADVSGAEGSCAWFGELIEN